MTTTQYRGLNIITGSARLPGDLLPQGPTGEPRGVPSRGVSESFAASSEDPPAPGVSWTMVLHNWMPTPLNRLLGTHWAKRGRMKAADAETVALEAARQNVPAATGKLRLSVLIVLPKGRRQVDPDAIQKSLADALVKCGALKNDSYAWVEHSPLKYAKGDRLCTYVTLEVIP